MGTNIDIPKEASKEVIAFAQRLLGPVADAADFLGDKIRFYRWQSALKTLERANEIATDRGITPNEIPLKFLVPFLEKCSLEESESDLQELWAQLLVTAVGSFDYAQVIYADMLTQLSPREIYVLKEMYKRAEHEDLRGGFSELEVAHTGLKIQTKAMSFIETKVGLLDGRGWYYAVLQIDQQTSKGEREFDQFFDAQETISILERQGLVEVAHGEGFEDESYVCAVTWAKLTTLAYRFLYACLPSDEK